MNVIDMSDEPVYANCAITNWRISICLSEEKLNYLLLITII